MFFCSLDRRLCDAFCRNEFGEVLFGWGHYIVTLSVCHHFLIHLDIAVHIGQGCCKLALANEDHFSNPCSIVLVLAIMHCAGRVATDWILIKKISCYS